MKETIVKIIKWIDHFSAVMRIKYRFGRCMTPGCWQLGQPCWIDYWDTVEYEDEYDNGTEGLPDYFYCWDHAPRNGFCKMCGLFCAGLESFDFSPVYGMCENCREEIEDECDPNTEYWWDDEEEGDSDYE